MIFQQPEVVLAYHSGGSENAYFNPVHFLVPLSSKMKTGDQSQQGVSFFSPAGSTSMRA
jgi:hypothetical protein